MHYSLGFLTLGGFVMGIVFWGGFNTALELTNTETFCTGCHEMRDNVFQELKPTIHYTNRSGVRATCPDCHVPHDWTDKIARKMQASKEVWGKIFGTINTREKFLAHRLELAQHEWARLEANDSLECRNCHSAESMDITRQSQRAAEAHERFLFTGERTCIDCHKGIAHRLPDMAPTGATAAPDGARGSELPFCPTRRGPIRPRDSTEPWRRSRPLARRHTRCAAMRDVPLRDLTLASSCLPDAKIAPAGRAPASLPLLASLAQYRRAGFGTTYPRGWRSRPWACPAPSPIRRSPACRRRSGSTPASRRWSATRSSARPAS